ncbi:MAG: hypothetical protein ABI215_08920 [Mycobacterium sp.]
MPQFGVRIDQRVQGETSVEPTRIGQHPGRGVSEGLGIPTPPQICPTDHGRQGTLSEKGDHSRCVSPHLGLESEPSLPELFRCNLVGAFRRPADHSGYAAAIFEQTTLVLRLQPYIGEARQMQHGPEAIASMRKIMAVDNGTGGWIQPAENHIETRGEDI